MSQTQRQIRPHLLDEMALDLFTDDPNRLTEEDCLRVEPILLELVRPDPLQPRRVLPERTYQAFHHQQLTPTQALRELIQATQRIAQQQGRPFANLLEWLETPDTRSGEELPDFSPEERQLRDLVNLALTLRDDGQVNPVTVVEVTQGMTRQYRLETGERRYWATWLLRDLVPDYQGEGTIPCIVIPSGSASAFRQAKENTARTGLSALALARQAALLLLTVHGFALPEGPVTMNFYRQALALDLRGHRDHTTAILGAMGGLSRQQFSRYKALLRLSDEAAELADRYQLDEGVLRYVVDLPAPQQTEVIQQIIAHHLTVKQVLALCAGDEGQTPPPDPLPKHTQQVVRLLRSAQTSTPDLVARLLLEQEPDIHLARARLQSFRQLLEAAEHYLI